MNRPAPARRGEPARNCRLVAVSRRPENTPVCRRNPSKELRMPHHTPLISTIVIGLVLAFVLGTLMQRIRVSPLVGYLLAGVVLGPFTPGFVADQSIAQELAELGVILLMF